MGNIISFDKVKEMKEKVAAGTLSRDFIDYVGKVYDAHLDILKYAFDASETMLKEYGYDPTGFIINFDSIETFFECNPIDFLFGDESLVISFYKETDDELLYTEMEVFANENDISCTGGFFKEIRGGATYVFDDGTWEQI